jgi:hypothetical protein
MTFLACSGSAVQRTKGHYVALRRPPRPLRKDEQQQMPKPRHIEGRHATRVATEVAMREPVRLLASADAGDEHIIETSSPSAHEVGKRAPPRVKKPSKHSDQVLAPAELGAAQSGLARGLRGDPFRRVRRRDVDPTRRGTSSRTVRCTRRSNSQRRDRTDRLRKTAE